MGDHVARDTWTRPDPNVNRAERSILSFKPTYFPHRKVKSGEIHEIYFRGGLNLIYTFQNRDKNKRYIQGSGKIIRTHFRFGLYSKDNYRICVVRETYSLPILYCCLNCQSQICDLSITSTQLTLLSLLHLRF